MKCWIILSLCCQINRVVAIKCDAEPKTTEATIRKQLLCNKYDKTERPVKNYTSPVIVNVDMVLINYDYNDNRQKLFIDVWWIFEWADQYLDWRHMESKGLKRIVVDSKDIWVPEIVPYTAYYNSDYKSACTKKKCAIQRDGLVRCTPDCRYHAFCQSDYTNWPFDRQNCTMRFSLWLENSKYVDFIASERGVALGVSDSNSHYERKLVSLTVQKHEEDPMELNGVNVTYPSLVYNFVLERYLGSQIATALVPAMIFVAMNITSLLLKCYSLERLLLLSISICIHFLMIQSIFWQIPYNGSTVPTLLIFYRDSLVLTTSILVLTVITKYLYVSAVKVPASLNDVITTITVSKVGQLVFGIDPATSYSEETADSDPQNAEQTSDSVILVGNNELVPKMTAKRNADSAMAFIFDRLVCFAVTIAYILMLLTLIPRN